MGKSSAAVQVLGAALVVVLLAQVTLQAGALAMNRLGEESHIWIGNLSRHLAASLVQLGSKVVQLLVSRVGTVVTAPPDDGETRYDGEGASGSESLPAPGSRRGPDRPLIGYAWSRDPLTVAIMWEGGVDSSKAMLIQAGIREWQDRLRSRANLALTLPTEKAPFGVRFANSPEADVVFVLKRQAVGKSLGVTTLTYAGGVIQSARIDMAVHTAAGLPLDPADIQNIAVHEFGHVLGLGHSTNVGDLMYEAYDFVRVRRVLAPSSCDVDRLLAVYRPDGFAAPNAPAALATVTCS